MYVAHSAFKDSRFRPLELPEVPDLEVKVSLLVNYEEGENAYDWEVRGGGGNSPTARVDRCRAALEWQTVGAAVIILNLSLR